MLALRTVLECRLPVKGLILLSSTLADRTALEDLIGPCPAVPVFQSHGTYDPLLPIQGADALEKLLRTQGWEVQYQKFPGMHAIPPNIISALTLFISDQLQ